MTDRTAPMVSPPAGAVEPREVAYDLLLAFAPIVLFGVLGNVVGLASIVGGALVNLGYLLSVLVAGWLLQRRGSSWRRHGLARPRSLWRSALLAVGTFVAAVVLIVAVQNLAALWLGAGAAPIDESRFDAIAGNVGLYALMLTLAWTTIAFGEEMMYRAFLIGRLQSLWSGTRWGSAAAVLLAAAVFGAVHFAEGPLGIVSNGAFGVLFGAVYLASGRNLWVTIAAHGLLNTVRFTLLFVGAV